MIIAEEVSTALQDGRAVVALESTIISHGLPRPRNLEIAAAIDLLEQHLAEGLRDTVDWLLRDGRGGDSGEVKWLVERASRGQNLQEERQARGSRGRRGRACPVCRPAGRRPVPSG